MIINAVITTIVFTCILQKLKDEKEIHLISIFA
jgi:hypothetical protein